MPAVSGKQESLLSPVTIFAASPLTIVPCPQEIS